MQLPRALKTDQLDVLIEDQVIHDYQAMVEAAPVEAPHHEPLSTQCSSSGNIIIPLWLTDELFEKGSEVPSQRTFSQSLNLQIPLVIVYWTVTRPVNIPASCQNNFYMRQFSTTVINGNTRIKLIDHKFFANQRPIVLPPYHRGIVTDEKGRLLCVVSGSTR